MSIGKEMRMERIKRIFSELRYEIERGFMEGEIDGETIYYSFVVPVSRCIPNGVVQCIFKSRPVPRDSMHEHDSQYEPKLKIIK